MCRVAAATGDMSRSSMGYPAQRHGAAPWVVLGAVLQCCTCRCCHLLPALPPAGHHHQVQRAQVVVLRPDTHCHSRQTWQPTAAALPAPNQRPPQHHTRLCLGSHLAGTVSCTVLCAAAHAEPPASHAPEAPAEHVHTQYSMPARAQAVSHPPPASWWRGEPAWPRSPRSVPRWPHRTAAH
jgi:hypothetical protein